MPGRIERRRRAGANATSTWTVSNVIPRQTAAATMAKDTSTPTGDIHNEITMIVDSPQQVQNQPPRARNPSNAVAVPVPAPREQDGQDNQVQAPVSEERLQRGRRRHGEGSRILTVTLKFLMNELMESSSDNDSDVGSSCSSGIWISSESQEEYTINTDSSSSDCDCDCSNCANSDSSEDVFDE